MKKIITLSGLAFAMVSSAYALNTTGNFNASTQLSSSCVITANSLSIGVITPATAPGSITATTTNAATAPMSVLCSQGLLYVATISYDNAGSSTIGRMTSSTSSDYIGYNLYYSKSAGAGYVAWGASKANGIQTTSTGVADSYLIKAIVGDTSTPNYGSTAYPTPGDYSSTVTVNLTY